ncbi:T9SS type A sorting domain-containing protein [Hymenobacter yonginensis]|uniref:T9SS type A sorting domain-containing protein n=1 Tax=Hymenobacter yonginensis TaxID=748197 RepID=A0ABY7PL76_9BACT|nr:T9SS type A sorting domain-containing protein [Hymenobacter yonginensis]WBO82770.1 T9SS type A sorting domain-containing protein [Hymenobacter yonginensis]
MNHTYQRNTRRISRFVCQMLFLVALVLPGFSNAQIFTESVGTTATEGQTIQSYNRQGGFDNDQEKGLQYQGNAQLSLLNPSTGYPNSSGSVNVLFPTNTGATSTFTIGDINLTGISNPQVRFALYIPAGGPTTIAALRNAFRLNLASSVDAASYSVYDTNVPYTPVSGITPGTWNAFVLNPAALPASDQRFLQLRFIRLNNTQAQARQYQLDDVTLSATTTPTILVAPQALSFGGQTVNTASAAQRIDVNAVYLNQDITVAAPAGFQVSLTSTGTYTSTVTLARKIDGSTSTSVFVRFLPTATGNYVDNVQFSSTGATTASVGVSGVGQTAPATLAVSTNGTLDFGSVVVGNASSPQSFTVSGNNLGANPVTVAAPSGYQVRTGTNVFGSSVTLTPVGGTVGSTQIDVQFVPTAAGTANGNVQVSAQGAPTQLVSVTGIGTAPTPGATINVSPASLAFGNITASGSGDTRQLTVSGTGLTDNITLTPSANVQIRNASAGGAFTSDALVVPRTGTTVVPTSIEVRLVALISGTTFNGNITVTSATASPVVVPISATSNGNISDISITNPANNSFTFATRPNSISVAQQFLLAGTNLLQPLTIAPTGPSAQYFQVSEDNVNFFNQLTFTPDVQGNVTQRPIYLRFLPGNNALTVNAIIRATSSPAPDRDVSVTGISEPTIRLSRLLGSFGDNVVKNTTTAPVTALLEGFLLGGNVDIRFPADTDDPTRNPLQTPQYELSLNNGASYSKIATITPDANGNFSQQIQVRYAPTRVGASAQELEVRNSSLNSGNFFVLTSGNGRVQGFAIAPVPTAQSTAVIARDINSSTATITFNLSSPPAGTSYGQNRLVIATTTYQQLPTNLFPQPKQNFNPGVTVSGAYQFGSGTAIEASTNTYVVFSGAANNFTVGNLTPGVVYYFYSFEFNDDALLNAENYRVPNNQPQVPLPVELKSFTAQLRNGQVNLNWVTASERNNQGFEVQRSQDGREFSTILFKKGNGTTSARSTYDAVDARPLAGLSYYRLKQIDTDGKFSYSPVVTVKNAGLTEASFYPNPTSGKLTVALPQATTAEGLRVRIADLTGRVLREQSLPVTGELDLTSMPAGTYMVTVGTGDQQVTRKVVKN